MLSPGRKAYSELSRQCSSLLQDIEELWHRHSMTKLWVIMRVLQVLYRGGICGFYWGGGGGTGISAFKASGVDGAGLIMDFRVQVWVFCDGGLEV